jgi:hypothetical protein
VDGEERKPCACLNGVECLVGVDGTGVSGLEFLLMNQAGDL